MSIDLTQCSVALLGSVDLVNMNGTPATETTIYTVPVGKKCVLNHVRIRNISATCSSATASFGAAGAARNFLGTQTLSALNVAGASGILTPIPAVITPIGYEYEAGVALVMKLIAAAGSACTATIEFFGTIDNA